MDELKARQLFMQGNFSALWAEIEQLQAQNKDLQVFARQVRSYLHHIHSDQQTALRRTKTALRDAYRWLDDFRQKYPRSKIEEQ